MNYEYKVLFKINQKIKVKCGTTVGYIEEIKIDKYEKMWYLITHQDKNGKIQRSWFTGYDLEEI